MPTSAIRGTKRRRFPEMLEDEDMEADASTARGLGGSTNKKKSGSTALIDAVSILASSKSEGEVRKFDFLTEQLQQQGELRRQELDLERERLAIEREKNTAEQKRTDMMMMQLQASLQRRSDDGIGQRKRDKRAKTDSSKGEDEDIIELDYY